MISWQPPVPSSYRPKGRVVLEQATPGGSARGEWAANSCADGCLDVYGERHPLIFDPALCDAVVPFVARSLWNRLRSSR